MADAPRVRMDAAEREHATLGLIFLKDQEMCGNG